MSKTGKRSGRTKAEIVSLVADSEGSGQSRREFCRESGLSVTALDSYHRRLAGESRMVEVRMGQSAPRQDAGAPVVVIRLRNGRVVELPLDAGLAAGQASVGMRPEKLILLLIKKYGPHAESPSALHLQMFKQEPGASLDEVAAEAGP